MPHNASWDFGPVIDLIESDSASVESPALLPRTQTLLDGSDGIDLEPVKDGSKATILLGSFNKLWETLGISIEAPPPRVAPDEHNEKVDVTIPSPPPAATTNGRGEKCEDDTANAPSKGNGAVAHNTYGDDADARAGLKESLIKLAKASSEDPYAGMTKKQRHLARKKANKERREEGARQKAYDESERAREELKTKVDQAVGTPIKAARPPLDDGSKQVTTRSRSNVGAKVRPATPIEVEPQESAAVVTRKLPARPAFNPGSTPAVKSQKLSERLKVTQNPPFTPTPDRPQGQPSLAPGAPPGSVPQFIQQRTGLKPIGQITPPLMSLATRGVTPGLSNLEASLQTQYTAYGTPVSVPYHAMLPPGFQTPLNRDATPCTPGTYSVNDLMKLGGRIPSMVQPFTPGKKAKKFSKQTREDRHFDFLKKLMINFPQDKKWLVSPMRLSNSDKMIPDGIHVFVDASNILIGFKESLKRNGGNPGVDMSFDCLALLLERRRPVAKRVYAGSSRLSAPIISNEKFNALAGVVGYEKNIYEQVFKAKELTESQKFFKDVDRVGWQKATGMRSDRVNGGGGSDSETGATPTTTPLPAPKWVEQGVDESLHLKMCQSIIDCDVPSTMVLATGDGAEAEYSDGFLAHVERALKKGWKVELVSWKQQTSGGYRNKKFRAKWGDKFNILELDEYLELMIDA